MTTVLLALALAIPLLMVVACVLWVRRRRTVAATFGEQRLLHRVAAPDLHAVPWRRVVPVLLAALALGFAVGDGRTAAAGDAAWTTGRDVVIVVDASASMLVEDVTPNRLELQRRTAHRLLAALPDDRVGLVAFAGQASVLAPPTRDHGAVGMMLDAVGPGIAVQSGSAIGAGLRQASGLLAAAPERAGARVVVLLSDGEIVGPGEEVAAAEAAARLATTLGITVHTVGIGTEAGGRVPDLDPDTGRRTGFKVDPLTGETAVSRLDAGALRRIAGATGGSYHHLTRPDDASGLVARLASGTADAGDERAPRYLWFVALALLLLASDAVADQQRRRAR